MGMATVFLNDARPFKQIVNIFSTKGSMWNMVKIAQGVSEKKNVNSPWFYTCI